MVSNKVEKYILATWTRAAAANGPLQACQPTPATAYSTNNVLPEVQAHARGERYRGIFFHLEAYQVKMRR
jgi:hypothetical protein